MLSSTPAISLYCTAISKGGPTASGANFNEQTAASPRSRSHLSDKHIRYNCSTTNMGKGGHLWQLYTVPGSMSSVSNTFALFSSKYSRHVLNGMP